jgi:hypothetical protein
MLGEYLRVIGIWKSGNCPLTPFPSNPQLREMTPWINEDLTGSVIPATSSLVLIDSHSREIPR